MPQSQITTYNLSVSGAVSRSDARLRGMWMVVGSILTFGNIFRGDWSWNNFYSHSLRSADSRRAVNCQLLVKECALSISKLPRKLNQEQCGYMLVRLQVRGQMGEILAVWDSKSPWEVPRMIKTSPSISWPCRKWPEKCRRAIKHQHNNNNLPVTRRERSYTSWWNR